MEVLKPLAIKIEELTAQEKEIEEICSTKEKAISHRTWLHEQQAEILSIGSRILENDQSLVSEVMLLQRMAKTLLDNSVIKIDKTIASFDKKTSMVGTETVSTETDASEIKQVTETQEAQQSATSSTEPSTSFSDLRKATGTIPETHFTIPKPPIGAELTEKVKVLTSLLQQITQQYNDIIDGKHTKPLREPEEPTLAAVAKEQGEETPSVPLATAPDPVLPDEGTIIEIRRLIHELAELYKERKTTQTKLDFDARLKELQSSVNNVANEQNDHQQPAIELKLDKIQLANFDGDLTQWIAFRDQFKDLVHDNPKLTAITKFYQLRNHLKGTAAAAINGFKLCAADYATAWDVLMRRYDRKDQIIDEYLRRFDQLPVLTQATSQNLINMVNCANQLTRVLPSLGVDCSTWGVQIMFTLKSKLDPKTLTKWNDQVKLRTDVKLQEFLEFLEVEAFECLPTQAERAHQAKQHARLPNSSNNKQQKRQKPLTMQITAQSTCQQCKDAHRIFACPVFKALPLKDRLKKVKEWKLCTRCLQTHSKPSDCQFGMCPICKKDHNKLLWQQQEKESTVQPSTSPIVANAIANLDHHEAGNVLGTAIITVANANPWNNKLRALCDTGSQISLITLKAVKKLGIRIQAGTTELTGPLLSNAGRAFGFVTLQITIPGINKVFGAPFHVVENITHTLPRRSVIKTHPEFNNLSLADPTYGTPSEIEALLGVRTWIKIVQPEIVRSADSLAIAQSTKLGYVIFQAEREPPMPTYATKPICHTVQISPAENYPNLTRLLTKFWEVEDLPVEHHRSKEEQACEDLFTSTYSRLTDGRYVVTMPFNEKIHLLGKSKRKAICQLFHMERKMQRNEQFHEHYLTFMANHEAMGYMTRINEEMEDGYYTPHHGIISANKFRVVFNASMPTSTGISLNECQMIGEKLQPDLAMTLLRFRMNKIAICADVKQMYCQIEIAPQHKKYQKILWRKTTEEPIGVYVLNRVAYGQTAAPHLAIRAMQQCAYDYKEQYPIGAHHVLQSFYVDDLLAGSDSINEIVEIFNQLTSIMEKGQLTLTKWCSNSSQVNKTLETEPNIVEIKDNEEKSVLGLQWHPSSDQLAFKVTSSINSESTWTKRKILSQIGKLYYPNGYLAPVVIVSKVLIQTIWKAGTDWDEPVPQTLLDQWTKFAQEIPDLKQVTIPRWIGMRPIWKTELHGFSDASMTAYAAVIYVRTIKTDGRITTALACSKTRVAPVKSVTIPRLELCGAYLLSKLIGSIIDTMGSSVSECKLWTDSTVTHYWVNTSPSELKTFVANRVAHIQRYTIDKGFSWHWIAGPENPADLATRGLTPHQLATSSLWWNGPPWLNKPETEWPQEWTPKSEPSPTEAISEHKQIVITHHTHLKTDKIIITRQKWQILDVYSSLRKLVRVLATVKRAIKNFMTKIGERHTGPLTDNELREATLLAVHLDQQENMGKQMQQQQNFNIEHPKEKNDRTIWYDEKTRVLRLNGRVQSDKLTYSEQFPIVLNSKGNFARLLLKDAHHTTLHGGVQQMLQLVRQQYWIYNARRAAKSVVHSCITCTRYRRQQATQLMAALPESRTKPARAFLKCGVDYAGPFGILSRTGRNPQLTKGYICLFVCFTTRAIHLELVSDASTNQFIQALRRLIARRGRVEEIWSDNGTVFVGANTYLTELYKKQNEWIRTGTLSKLCINWHFIAPHAPSWGGLWEAGVKSVKRHLVRTIGTQNLTFEEFYTLLTQVEACVNSRPIVPLSDDPQDLNALTPGHFLVGESLITLPEARQLDTDTVPVLKRWEMVQRMNQIFWKRWHTEYITNLSQRPKWKTQTRNMEVGDMVVVFEDNLPPSKWLLGRIVEVFQSTDGLIRAAKVKTSHGEYTRPILKLGLLFPEKIIQ